VSKPKPSKFDSIVGKLGFHTLGAGFSVFGALAPALSSPPGTAISVAALGIGSVGGWLGSYWTGRAASRADDRDSRRIPPAEVLLHNHDLTDAVALAIRRTIEAAQQDKGLLDHAHAKHILGLLAADAAEFYAGLVTPLESAAKLVQPDALIPGVESPRTVLSDEEWRALLERLFSWRKQYDDLRLDFEKLLPPLARYMGETFPQTMRELMEYAAANPGTDLAKAYAAIEMHVWAQLLCFVRESGSRDAALEQRIAGNLERALRNMGDAAIARHSELVSMVAALVPGVERLEGDVRFLAESARRGLVPLEEFGRRYWRERSSDPGMKLLFQTEERRLLLQQRFAARGDELARFQSFLSAGDKEVLYFYGDPGAGKSRLVLEMAQTASQAGWRPLFLVPETLKNLDDAVSGLKDPGARYLLIWDDFRAEHRTALDQFLKLHTILEPERPRIKRILTSWPVFRSQIEERGKPYWLEAFELKALDTGDDSWASFIRDLAPARTQDFSRCLSLSAGNPFIALLAIDLVLGGRDPGELSGYESICGQAYGPIVARIEERDREAFQALCACGAIASDRTVPQHQSLDRLWKQGFLSRIGGEYRPWSDIMRAFVCRQSFLQDRNPLSLPAPAGDWARIAAAYFPRAFPKVWQVTAQALQGEGQLAPLAKRELLSVARAMAAEIVDGDSEGANEWALALFNATAGEPSPAVCREIGREIEAIAQRHSPPLPAIDEPWAKALHNATVNEPSPAVCRDIAREIEAIAQRHSPPLPAIDEPWAKALFNATAGEPSSAVWREIALEIEAIAQRHSAPLPAIDEWWATALYSATVGEPSPTVCREIAGEIEAIANRHSPPLPAIDRLWAMALYNATVGEPSPAVCREIAREIEAMAQRHSPPLPAIDEWWAMALWNATAVEPSPATRREIAREIEAIAQRYSPPLPAIDEPWAKALFNATAVEPSPAVRREIAREIGAIAQRHWPPLPAIDEPWAKAFCNATAVEPSPVARREIAREIEAVAQRHSPPLPAIDEWWANALFNATVGEPSPAVRREIAREIAAITQRHSPPLPAIDARWAMAACLALGVEDDVTEATGTARQLTIVFQRQDKRFRKLYAPLIIEYLRVRRDELKSEPLAEVLTQAIRELEQFV
jgi:hypothetical protein